jgi:hypothetical protein
MWNLETQRLTVEGEVFGLLSEVLLGALDEHFFS